VPAGEHIGQGMGEVIPLAKYSIDCRSGASSEQLGGDYTVIQVGFYENPLKFAGRYVVRCGKSMGCRGARNSNYTRRT
jgi:hypothetical protein